MVIMESTELLTEMSKFLELLAKERLSEHAEACRRQLLARIASGEVFPHPYIDMNGGFQYHQSFQQQIGDCYEEFDNSFHSNSEIKQEIPEGYVNGLYNNLSLLHKENIYANNDHDSDNYVNLKDPNQHEESTYIKPSSSLANTPVCKIPSYSEKTQLSNSNSERNSIISCKKDSPDRTSDSSSFTSSSTRCDESPEVLATSASALRYAATKSGNLGRREKVMFVYHTKFYWAAVFNQTLFMFQTDKSSRPQFELDITGYKARPVAICSNNKDFKFELVCPGKKTHQFFTEKQSDMDRWISALNVATKTAEPLKEWSRQLPLLPQTEEGERYDQPDGMIEAEYELPDTIVRHPTHTRSHSAFKQELAHYITSKLSLSSNKYTPSKDSDKCSFGQSMKSKEVRGLPPTPLQQEMYDHPDPSIRPVASTQPELYECVEEQLYHCIESQVPKEQGLPLLPPQQEVYDQPEPKIRPVLIQEELYSVIDNNLDTKQPTSSEAVYNNIENNEFDNENNVCNYYNVIPYPEREREQECIYDVITEQRSPPDALSAPEQLKSDAKKNITTVKQPTAKAKLTEEIIMKFEGKKPSTVSNTATINKKQFITKPKSMGVKTPVVNKIYQ